MNEILIYKNENQIEVEITYLNNNLGLSLNQISAFFEDDKSVTSIHFISIYKYNELTEKAENLLYLVVKNHSFTDGNKRIAA